LRLCSERLLIPRGDLDKRALALAEGGRLKKLCGYVRAMFRDSSGSRNEKIAELKGLLVKRTMCTPSPTESTSASEGSASASSLEAIADAEQDSSGVQAALCAIERVLGDADTWGYDEWTAVDQLLCEVPKDTPDEAVCDFVERALQQAWSPSGARLSTDVASCRLQAGCRLQG